MTRQRLVAIPLVLTLALLPACGDDEVAPATTSAAPVTTGTVASTTTAAPASTTAATTTSPDDQHPAWPVSWAAFWPADGSTATVLAAGPDGSLDSEMGLEYGLDWDGGTWDRIWLGTPEEGQLGVSFYFARPEPWVMVLWGAVTYSPWHTMTERFDPPITLDLQQLPDGATGGETTVVISDESGQLDEGAYTLTLSLVGFEDVEVAAGQFTNTAHLHLTAEEPGGYVAETDIWIDGTQALVRLAPAHVLDSLELAALWSE